MRSRSALVTLAAAAVTLSGCGFHGLYGVNLPGGTNVGNHPYTVYACFANVLDLVPQSNVKVNDVAVGKVESISLTKKSDKCIDPVFAGWSAKVKLVVRSDVNLPDNARASIQQTSLLGEKYVQLAQPYKDPSSARLHNGSTIPLADTGSAPEVEQVLAALSLVLNGGGIQQIHVIATQLTDALHGNEAAVRDLFTQLQSFTGSLNQQKLQIVNALVSLDKLSATLNQQRNILVDTLSTMPQALKVLSDERGKLVGLLQGLSHLGVVATDVVTKTESALVDSLQALNPTLTTLTAAGADLPKALKILGTFPFPVGLTTRFVRGDYANLHLDLDLNLQDELCALLGNANGNKLPAICKLALPSSKGATKAGADSQASTQLAPMLIGASG